MTPTAMLLIATINIIKEIYMKMRMAILTHWLSHLPSMRAGPNARAGFIPAPVNATCRRHGTSAQYTSGNTQVTNTPASPTPPV